MAAPGAAGDADGLAEETLERLSILRERITLAKTTLGENSHAYRAPSARLSFC